MKIKLIAPRMSLRPMDSEFKRRISPSLSLVTIASLITKQHFVYIEDENIQKINFNDHPDLVGITVNVDTSKRAYKIASIYRKKSIKVVLGGIHVSANPLEAINYADSLCIGEAEEVINKIVIDAKNNKLKKYYYNSSASDPKNIPLPSWSMINKSKYLYTNIICSSRGCPFKCEFCYNSCKYVHHNYRNRPIANVIDEIIQMNTKQVMFIDDNFIGNPQHALELARELKKHKLTWHAAVSTNLVGMPKLMDLMKESGCKSLFIGFESINQDSLAGEKKTQNNVGLYQKLIKDLHARNIMINASLVFGLDNDTEEVFTSTLDWLVDNKIETMTAHILTPYPGTQLYKRFLTENRITDFNSDNYNTANVVFIPKKMTAKQLQDGYLWMYDQFYSLKNIFNRLPEKRQQRLPFLLFNLGYRKYGKIISLFGRLGLMSFIGKMGRKLSYNIE